MEYCFYFRVALAYPVEYIGAPVFQIYKKTIKFGDKTP